MRKIFFWRERKLLLVGGAAVKSWDILPKRGGGGGTQCTREIFISGISMYCGGKGIRSSGWDEMGLTLGIEFEQSVVPTFLFFY